MSLPWWQRIAVAWNRTALATSRNEPSKKDSVLGRARYTVQRDVCHHYCVYARNTYARLRNHTYVYIISVLALGLSVN